MPSESLVNIKICRAAPSGSASTTESYQPKVLTLMGQIATHSYAGGAKGDGDIIRAQ